MTRRGTNLGTAGLGLFAPSPEAAAQQGLARAPAASVEVDTSLEAARDLRQHLTMQRLMVLGYIVAAGDTGATCDEAEGHLHLTHQSCSARFTELANVKGKWPWPPLIARTTARRRTRQRQSAGVYIATRLGRRVIDAGPRPVGG